MLLLTNAKILTFDENMTIIEDGTIFIENGTIKDIGNTEELEMKYPDAIFKNVKNNIVMPGLINTHTHLYSTFARGMGLKDKPPSNFVEILKKLWWRLDNTLNEKDIYYSALFAICECIRNGVTTIFDHHASYNYIDGSLDIIEDAVKRCGIRANLSYEISDRHGKEKSQAAIKENERFIRKVQRIKNSHLKGLIGLHASFTLEDETLKTVSELSQELNVPIHVHVAEGIQDYQDSVKRGYNGVIDRLNRFNILNPGSLLVHGVHIQKEEIDVVKRSGSYLIHNPESNMNNAVGAAPIKSFIENNIVTGLGTDAYTHDMFESIKTANLLYKHESKDPRVGWNEIYDMAFINNKKIASRFFDKKLGSIEKGLPADLIVIDYSSPTPIEKENVFAHILFGINGSMVQTVLVDGKILMDNREVTFLDYEQLRRKTQKQARDFWERF